MPTTLNIVALFGAALVNLFIIYFGVPDQVMWQICILILVMVLILFNVWVVHSKSVTPKAGSRRRSILLFLVSSFVMGLVHSTGSFFSPLLFLIHLTAISYSFLLNMSVGSLFLFFSIGLFALEFYVNPLVYTLFTSDPWAVVLYVISFVILFFLLQLVSNYYRYKDKIVSLLQTEIGVWEQKEQLIMQKTEEMLVLVSDSFVIESASQPFVEKCNTVFEEIDRKPLFSVITLVDNSGHVITEEMLKTRLEENVTHEDVVLDHVWVNFDKSFFRPIRGELHVSIVQDSRGMPVQYHISFSLDAAVSKKILKVHKNLQENLMNYLNNYQQILQSIPHAKPSELSAELTIFMQNIQDLSTMISLEQPQFPTDLQAMDIGKNLFDISQETNNFGLIFNVFVYFSEHQTSSFMPVGDSTVSGSQQGRSDSVNCTIYTQTHMWNLMVKKLLQLCILLGADRPGSVVNMFYDCSPQEVRVIMRCPYFLPVKNVSWLFNEDYTHVVQSFDSGFTLKRGSALEGIIIKDICALLGIKIETRLVKEDQLEVVLVHPH